MPLPEAAMATIAPKAEGRGPCGKQARRLIAREVTGHGVAAPLALSSRERTPTLGARLWGLCLAVTSVPPGSREGQAETAPASCTLLHRSRETFTHASPAGRPRTARGDRGAGPRAGSATRGPRGPGETRGCPPRRAGTGCGRGGMRGTPGRAALARKWGGRDQLLSRQTQDP